MCANLPRSAGTVRRVSEHAPTYDVGIAGAGQLAQMTVLAAWPLGIRVAVLGQPGEPATPMAAGVVEGDWKDRDALLRIGREVGVLTLENEFVDAEFLMAVEDAGTPVRPHPARMRVVQDKALQKQRLADEGLPVPPFAVPDSIDDLEAIGRDLGWPLMLKSRHLGYDGYGNALCADPEEARAAYPGLAERGGGVLVEQFVNFQRELAVMVAREIGVSERDLEDLRYAALMHDIGQLSLPQPIPGGTTTILAYHDQKRIADLGADVIEQAGLPRAALIVRRQADPYRPFRGTLDDSLPIESRIIKVVNAYDDLVGSSLEIDRKQGAVERLELAVDRDYDPVVVDTLSRIIERQVEFAY